MDKQEILDHMGEPDYNASSYKPAEGTQGTLAYWLRILKEKGLRIIPDHHLRLLAMTEAAGEKELKIIITPRSQGKNINGIGFPRGNAKSSQDIDKIMVILDDL